MRRSSRIFRASVLAVGLAVALAPMPAGADHNADDHSANMAYQGTAPQGSFTNSDLAFWGNYVFAGNYGGFRVIDISDPTDIENPANVLADVSCPGAQFDISVYNNDADPEADLVFASVDAPRSDDSCSSGPTTAGNVDSWEGVRIFDINDLNNIQQIAQVPADCGSHTHTLVPDPNNADRVFLYVSSYPLGSGAVTTGIPARADVMVDGIQFDFPAGVRNNGTECLEPEPGEAKPNGIHNKISIITVDLTDPATADDRTPSDPDGPGGNDPIGWSYDNVREVSLPLAGYEAEVPIGSRSFEFTACHDIAVFSEKNRAVGACWREAIMWDVTDPSAPLFLRRWRTFDVDTLFHSVTFSWDGKVVALEDEAGGGGAARCKLEDGETDPQGSIYFYSMAGRRLGDFKIPRHITGNCTAHNYNTIPLNNGRRVLVSAWYSGGTSVVDYTDPANPKELGHYIVDSPINDAPPPAPAVHANTWSSYWYNGWVYANDIPRGLDVYSFNHRVLSGEVPLPFLNPQTQMDLIAQTYRFATKATMGHSNRPHRFKGSVRSADDRCEADRSVVVKKVRPGRDRVVGRATTNDAGRWSVAHNRGGAGTYYAIARRASMPDGIDTVVCRSDRSPRRSVSR